MKAKAATERIAEALHQSVAKRRREDLHLDLEVKETIKMRTRNIVISRGKRDLKTLEVPT